MMDRQPTLEGPTLLIRPLAPDDRDALYAVAGDPLVWEVHPAHDRHEEAVFHALFEESLASGGALVVIDKATGHVIGSSRYDFTHAEPGEVEIGWTFLARSHWGGAANREMKRLMLSHAFGAAARVMFRIGEHNLRSRRAMEKIGGMLSARTQISMMAGREVVHVVYTIDREAFAAGPLA